MYPEVYVIYRNYCLLLLTGAFHDPGDFSDAMRLSRNS
jgi:hypothetical protein